jgi:translation initiation factor 5
MVVRDCKACGECTSVDMRHRLSTYILKNSPKKKSKKNKGGHAEAPSPSNEVNGGVAAGENGEAEAEAGSEDEMTRHLKSEASGLPAESQLVDEGWSADTSPEAVKVRIGAVAAGLGILGLSGGGDNESGEDADSPYTHLGIWVGENAGARVVDVFKKVQDLGIEKKHKAVQFLVQTLFTKKIITEIPHYIVLFQKVHLLPC